MASNTPFAQALLAWFDSHARSMPWRGQTDPYKIWISEVMLQQTRVEAAREYYLRFTQALPDVQALAAVPEDRLFKLWEGLGYYSRARSLKKAAERIVREFDGRLPPSEKQLRTLPGVGEYTAGAVASIAFGECVPAVDGNVLRVMTRLCADGGNTAQAATRRRIAQAVMQHQPADAPGQFNQALMELGALVCLPQNPRCESCPAAEMCRAKREGRQHELPVRPERAPRRVEARTVLVVRCAGRFAVRRRAPRGLLAGLWEFPSCEGHLSEREAWQLAQQWGLSPGACRRLDDVRHVFTHREWDMRGFLLRAERCAPAFEWADAARLRGELALPAAFARFAAQAGQIDDIL